jgi:hypothetical protein
MDLSSLFNFKADSPILRRGQGRLKKLSSASLEASAAENGDAASMSSLDTKPEDEDVMSLNKSLEILVTVFPDIQVEVFREMLSTFDEESRLHVVTEALLKHKIKWVRGRWRVRGEDEERDQRNNLSRTVSDRKLDNSEALPQHNRFRSHSYKKAVRATLYQEFRGLSHSSIDAVLAENNYSYTLSRPTLIEVSSKSWRFSISSFFLRRKSSRAVLGSNHPLLSYQTVSGEAPAIPSLRQTESYELNRELYETLIRPLQRKRLEEQEGNDHELALQVNEAEAEQFDALHDCECCFTSRTFEQLSSCSIGGHFICYQCIQHTANEALYGQGWARSVDTEHGTLRCLAPSINDSGDCNGCIPHTMVERALNELNDGVKLWTNFQDRLAAETLLQANAPLVRCPFCVYAEIDEIYIPTAKDKWHFKRSPSSSLITIFTLVFGTGMIPFVMPFILIASIVFTLLRHTESFPSYMSHQLVLSQHRLARRHRGLKFQCENPSCRRASCICCFKPWQDIHVCYESSLLALRACVERAMAEAVKRTCPRCNVSFIKASGCNKLRCVCGYQMCYVCRADIGKEGYRHFCEHFRPSGEGECAEACGKCDLYKVEDEEAAVKRAAQQAEGDWRAREGVGGEWRWEDRGKTVGQDLSYGHIRSMWVYLGMVRFPGLKEAIDWFVFNFVEW